MNKLPGIGWLIIVIGICWVVYKFGSEFAQELQLQKNKSGKGNKNPGAAKDNTPATISDAQAAEIAEEVADAYGPRLVSLGLNMADPDALISAFKKIQNDNDFLAVNAAFGISKYQGSLIGKDKSMTDYITAYFAPATIDTINNDLKNRGINYSI